MSQIQLNKDLIALIPLRGGSKEILNKNIKKIAGKPLYYWATKAAVESNIFKKIIISSDSDEIIKSVMSYFPNEVEILRRPEDLAQDHSSTEDVMVHLSCNYQFDILCTIQVTSPLVESQDFVKAWESFTYKQYDSMFTGVVQHRFYWTRKGSPLNYNPINRPRRQDFTGSITENGAFYFTSKWVLEKFKCRLGGKIGVYEMDKKHLIEIDTKKDWDEIERFMNSDKFLSNE